MIRPPSLQRTYNEHWSEDSSFEQAPVSPSEGATDEERAAYVAAMATYATRAEVAWETGDWSGLRVAGAGEPTTFVMRPLSTEQFCKLADMRSAGLGENELAAYAFRCALVSVSNLGDVKVSFVDDEKLGRIASLAFLTEAGAVGALGTRLVRELGARTLMRARGPSPK